MTWKAELAVFVVLVVLTLGLLSPRKGLAQSQLPERIPLVLTGVVRVEGTPDGIPGVEVYVGGSPWVARTDQAGRYRIDAWQHVLDRPSAVGAALPGFFGEERYLFLGCHWLVTPAEEDPVCELEVDFTMRPADFTESESEVCTISGTLGSEPRGEPLRGMVEVVGLRRGAVADEEGLFELRGVSAGLHQLRASSAGSFEQRRAVWVDCSDPSQGPSLIFRLFSAPIT